MQKQQHRRGAKFIQHLTWKLEEHHKEQNSGFSETLPNEALTIKEIFEKHTKGLPIDNFYREVQDFSDEPDHDDVDLEKAFKLDPAEAEILRNEQAYNTEAKKQALKEQVAEEKAKADRDRLSERDRERFKEREKEDEGRLSKRPEPKPGTTRKGNRPPSDDEGGTHSSDE